MNNKQLIDKLQNANVVCQDCGRKYGVYSVGCSSVWEGVCNVCGETKPVTEARDYGYLITGILQIIKEGETKAKIKEQVETFMEELHTDEIEDASYEIGDITCKFTEAELTALAKVLDAHEEEHPPGWNVDYDSAFEKVMELYGDNCVKYNLSPAMKKFHELYGTYGIENEVEVARWEGFRDAFNMNAEGAQ